nr:response regulator transcription factor [Tepidanaerobacter acetatoxydans]
MSSRFKGLVLTREGLDVQGNARILVVDDEKRIVDLVRLYLEREGFIVDEAFEGQQALDMISSVSYDLIILDLMLPVIDGWTVCKQIREKYDTPVIMLTARGEEFDKVLGFELGADDYVVKPFSPRELTARVKALLRRMASKQDYEAEALIFPELVIDPAARVVKVDGKEVALTPKEFDLLYFLAKNKGKAFNREKLLKEVWGYDFYGSLRTVDTHIKQLREKLGRSKAATYINTVWGIGYKFEVEK